MLPASVCSGMALRVYEHHSSRCAFEADEHGATLSDAAPGGRVAGQFEGAVQPDVSDYSEDAVRCSPPYPIENEGPLDVS